MYKLFTVISIYFLKERKIRKGQKDRTKVVIDNKIQDKIELNVKLMKYY